MGSARNMNLAQVTNEFAYTYYYERLQEVATTHENTTEMELPGISLFRRSLAMVLNQAGESEMVGIEDFDRISRMAKRIGVQVRSYE